MTKEISAYSPILKPSISKDMSSMSSLSPLLNQNNNERRDSYSKNKNMMNAIYNREEIKNPFGDSQSVHSF